MTKLTLAQIRIALDEVNKYYTAQELGREPTPMECVEHYVEQYRKTHKEDPLVEWFEGKEEV